MNTETKLTETELLSEMRRAAELLGLGHVEAAHLQLTEAIENAPWGSPVTAAAAKAANLIHPCDAPNDALCHLIAVLNELAQRPKGRW